AGGPGGAGGAGAQAAWVRGSARGGGTRGIAILSPRRSPAVPEIPTSDESGVPGLYASGWFGLFAPKGTPSEIIAKLNGAMVQVLADDTVRKRFAELGLDVAAREEQTADGPRAFRKA